MPQLWFAGAFEVHKKLCRRYAAVMFWRSFEVVFELCRSYGGWRSVACNTLSPTLHPKGQVFSSRYPLAFGVSLMDPPKPRGHRDAGGRRLSPGGRCLHASEGGLPWFPLVFLWPALKMVARKMKEELPRYRSFQFYYIYFV